MTELIKAMKRETKSLKNVVANNHRPEIREAFAAKMEVWQQSIDLLKKMDPGDAIKILEIQLHELNHLAADGPDKWTVIGRRQGTESAIKMIAMEVK